MKRAFGILFELLGIVARLMWLDLSFHKGKHEARVQALKAQGKALCEEFSVLSEKLDKEHRDDVERYRQVKAEIDKLNKKGK